MHRLPCGALLRGGCECGTAVRCGQLLECNQSRQRRRLPSVSTRLRVWHRRRGTDAVQSGQPRAILPFDTVRAVFERQVPSGSQRDGMCVLRRRRLLPRGSIPQARAHVYARHVCQRLGDARRPRVLRVPAWPLLLRRRTPPRAVQPGQLCRAHAHGDVRAVSCWLAAARTQCNLLPGVRARRILYRGCERVATMPGRHARERD